ncbi:uncharacterized protein conserved in bacteria [Halothermothrix orenii H 168]|uniref:Uncharacterized protein conserved in bacteria n=2 Tax=Halothermothrix orenii TaxID=31909 RepID=B8CXI5_HALOH|nr:uncharacterized protein conserved in bacteria [Halothermothrix orenii H 168]
MFKKYGKKVYHILLITLLILNIVLTTRVLGWIYLPGEVTPLDKAKQGAQAVINYSEDLAKSYGVARSKSVKDILARFKYEIEKSSDPEEVASLMLDYGRQTQDIIFREVQNKRLNTILDLINRQELPKEGSVTISMVNGKVKFYDPRGILEDKIRKKIKEISLNQTVEIVIENKRARVITSEDIFNQVEYLQTKIASLERQLTEIKKVTGYGPLSGPGIIIKVYDKNGNLEKTGIVHSTDIRNIVDELIIAGAKGVEVGGQRLTVHSAIRCVGPTILVNNKPIPVNPIVIKAVGDPEVLASSLNIVRNHLKAFGIELKVTKQKEISLKGQS